MIPAIVIIETDTLVLHTPYNMGFVEELKAAVPWSLRSWDGAAKVWKVDPIFQDQVIGLCDLFFGNVDVDDRRPAGPPAISGPAVDNWADALFDAITDPELRTRVYRKVAMALHPDKGGDVKLMQQFTEAYARRHKS
jgi:hypothetical protein